MDEEEKTALRQENARLAKNAAQQMARLAALEDQQCALEEHIDEHFEEINRHRR